MDISLKCNSQYSEIKLVNKINVYSDIDDYTSVLADICLILEETNYFEFVFKINSKFIPVDVGVDLRTMMEEISETLNFIDILKITTNDSVYILDLYEQGIETKIHISRRKSILTVNVLNDRMNEIFSIQLLELDAIFTALLTRFIIYSSLVCPQLIRSNMLAVWLDYPGIRSRLII